MSTILYEDEKFLRIYATMNLNGTAYAYLFGYPEGWQTSMSQHYQPFLDNLRIANIRAYNDRYDDADELPYSLLDFTPSRLAVCVRHRVLQVLTGSPL